MSNYEVIEEGATTEKGKFQESGDGLYMVSCPGCGNVQTIRKPEFNRAWVRCDSDKCGRVDNCTFIPKSEG